MKLIDSIIQDIPLLDIEKNKSEEMNYLCDSRIILDRLKEFEVDIPSEYLGKKDLYDFDTGVLEYMCKLTNKTINDFKSNNTYNYGGRITHDFNYTYYENEEEKTFYVAIMVHRIGDIRVNYTDYFLLKFESLYDFLEVIEEICSDNFGGIIEYNGKHYIYDLSIFSEDLRVWCNENEEEYRFYAYDKESFIEEIKKVEGKR